MRDAEHVPRAPLVGAAEASQGLGRQSPGLSTPLLQVLLPVRIKPGLHAGRQLDPEGSTGPQSPLAPLAIVPLASQLTGGLTGGGGAGGAELPVQLDPNCDSTLSRSSMLTSVSRWHEGAQG